MTLETIIKRLDDIARRNKDKFAYRIELSFKGGLLHYHFVAAETEEGHAFVEGTGLTIGAMVEAADREIPAACKTWDY